MSVQYTVALNRKNTTSSVKFQNLGEDCKENDEL